MACTRVASADNDDDDILAVSQVGISARKEHGAAEPDALTDVIRIGPGPCNPFSVLW